MRHFASITSSKSGTKPPRVGCTQSRSDRASTVRWIILGRMVVILPPAHAPSLPSSMIARSDEQLLVSDLGSTVGTIADGQPIGDHFMCDAAPLRIDENDVLAGGRAHHSNSPSP